MKVKNNRLYPFPVYSKNSDDYIDNNFSVTTELEYDSYLATIVLNICINDIEITKKIKNGIVGIYCHIECSATKYRELFEIEWNEFEITKIEIPLYKLNESIEILTVLVAKESIINYENSNLNDFYKGEIIQIPQYATIGYTETTEFILNKRINSNGDIPSIFVIVKSEAKEEMTFEASNDQIQIFLPKDEYEIYESHRGISKRLKQLMINLPVLVEIFDLIKQDSSSYDTFGWYSVLENSIIKCGYADGFQDEKIKNTSSMILGQKVLGSLLKDAFKEFETLNELRGY